MKAKSSRIFPPSSVIFSLMVVVSSAEAVSFKVIMKVLSDILRIGFVRIIFCVVTFFAIVPNLANL